MGVAKGLKKKGEKCLTLHDKAALGLRPPFPGQTGTESAIVFSPGVGTVFSMTMQGVHPSLPDPASYLSAGDQRQRVSQSRALRDGVTERGTPFAARAKKAKPHRVGQVHRKSFSELPDGPGSGRQQKTKCLEKVLPLHL